MSLITYGFSDNVQATASNTIEYFQQNRIMNYIYMFESRLPQNLKNKSLLTFWWDWLLHNNHNTGTENIMPSRPADHVTVSAPRANQLFSVSLGFLQDKRFHWNLIHFWRSPCIGVTERSLLQQSEISLLKTESVTGKNSERLSTSWKLTKAFLYSGFPSIILMFWILFKRRRYMSALNIKTFLQKTNRISRKTCNLLSLRF